MNAYTDHTDIALVKLTKEGDHKAFTELYERYRLQVYKHAFLFHQDYDKAQDVMQEVFVKLWQKKENIEIKSNFAGYIQSIVRHIILNQIAHQKIAQKHYDYTEWNQVNQSNAVEDYIIEKELTEILQSKIDKLPRKMKEIFILSRQEQLSHQEISDQLKISTKTVRQQIYNALLNLKSNLKYILIYYFFS